MKRDAIGLQVSLDVDGRSALVVGGGEEAEDKVARLLDGGARVTVLATQPSPSLGALAQAGRIALFPREFRAADLREMDLVLVCERDPALAERAFAASQQEGVACWACDDPERSHLAMPALVRLGRARLAVSTGGASPALAARLRAALERDLGEPFAAFVERLGRERERLLAEEPDPERRREQLRALVDGFDVTVRATYPTSD
jgi:precorrin-2 dehydrogenase/sirohydrochlorin ferrochelatase